MSGLGAFPPWNHRFAISYFFPNRLDTIRRTEYKKYVDFSVLLS
jgi:hypothetical protein